MNIYVASAILTICLAVFCVIQHKILEYNFRNWFLEISQPGLTYTAINLQVAYKEWMGKSASLYSIYEIMDKLVEQGYVKVTEKGGKRTFQLTETEKD